MGLVLLSPRLRAALEFRGPVPLHSPPPTGTGPRFHTGKAV